MNLLITGSSSGIGHALSQHLLGQGHHVWGLARSDQSAAGLAAPGRFRSSRADVSDWTQVLAVAQAVGQEWSCLDGLVLCAGIQGEISPALSANPERWSQTVRANLDGTYFPLRAFHPLLQRSPRRAKVVCFSGGGGTKARVNFSAYGVAKTGILRLVETVAAEAKDAPLDINAIAPGAINTRLTDEVIALGPTVVGQAEYDTAVKQKASGSNALEKTIDLVDWLLSPASDGVSGRLLAAVWDPWAGLGRHTAALAKSDVYTLRRILPEERSLDFNS
jgi:NAD(P)-dependent dehydrogenase (short-subunit alcohol dehydrogenase family)